MTLCRYPGCRKTIPFGESYCAEHKVFSRDSSRKDATQRGYTYKWKKEAKKFLAQHPLCAECEKQGRLTLATDVDHIKPHCGNQKLFWDKSNWQPLCHSCHSRKTAQEDGGFGNGVWG